MSTPSSPITDLAAPVLAGEPTINDQQRADLWDAFQAKDPDELVAHLQPLVLPDDFKKKLVNAKVQEAAAAPPIDKATVAMNKLAQMDPKVLDLAESHPNVLKVLTAAATVGEKGSDSASTASSSSSKGKTSKAAATPALPPQPPRVDGLEHMPPIPTGHRRVLASDGGVHDIPEENLEQARGIDPRLHVLNP